MAHADYNISDLPGKHQTTTFISEDSVGSSFLIEKIDNDLYEFTICVYDGIDEKTMNRNEYVLHCKGEALNDLKKCIAEEIELNSK